MKEGSPMNISSSTTSPENSKRSGNGLYFIGLLANTDSTILSVGLEKNFVIESLPEAKMAELLSGIENISDVTSNIQHLRDHHCVDQDEKMCYYASRRFMLEDKDWPPSHHRVSRYNDHFVQEYLEPAILSLRFFKGGNICMPLHYYYYYDTNGKQRLCGLEGGRGKRGFGEMVIRERFSLRHEEIEGAEQFLKNGFQPSEPYVRLAMDYFHHSYKTGKRSIVFSLLLQSIGVLLTPRGTDAYPEGTTRNMAILLGEDSQGSRNIQRDADALFAKNITHMQTGNGDQITKRDVVKARAYARESISEIMRLGLGKERLMDMLARCGYGDGPRKA